MLRRLTIAVVCCLLVSAGSLRGADTVGACPAAGEVEAAFETTVGYDPERRRFDYRYRLAVDSASPRSVITVALRGEPPLLDVRTPDGWLLTRMGPRRSRLIWDLRILTREGSEAKPSSYGMPPGSDVEGFGFTSPNPPGPRAAFLLGGADYSSIRRRILNRKLPLECVVLFRGGFVQRARRVETVAPDTFVRARMDVRPGRKRSVIDPSLRREMAVVLLDSDTVPTEDIVKGSVRIGPGLAGPRWESGHRLDANGDGRTDRLFHVRMDELGVTCGQTHLMVTGWFRQAERSFLARDSIQVAGCN